LATDVRKLLNNIKSKDFDTIEELVFSNTCRTFVSIRSKVESQLIEILNSCVDSDVKLQPAKDFLVMLLNQASVALDIEVPSIVRRLKLKPRQTKRSTRFGVEVELLVAIARLVNRPLSPDQKWSESIELDAVEDLLESLDIPADQESEFLDALEGVRMSYGYHCFVSLDENNIADEVVDGVEPDLEELIDCCEEICEILKIESFEIPSLDKSKWTRAEKNARAKADLAIEEAISDREALRDL
jgi:hypothetical protein